MTSKEDSSGGDKRCQALLLILDQLAITGIEIDKNLRQPPATRRIDTEELAAESFATITDLLSSRRIPLWLAQRIAWVYTHKFQRQIQLDLGVSAETAVTRDKLVAYLRAAVPDVIKEWLKEREHRGDKLFSLERSVASDQMVFEYGMKNKRRLMEDKVAILEDIDIFNDSDSMSATSKSSRPNAIFGVFDGHCGLEAAQYVSVHLPFYLLQQASFFTALASPDRSQIERLLAESFDVINERFTKKAIDESLKSGTTGCLCLLTGSSENDAYQRMSVAWCGDTQLCLVKNGRVDFITDTHKPNNKSERERIEKAGGSVCYLSNAWRINGSLAVARSFGDVEYQPSVTAKPQIEHFALDPTVDDYIIIGCDGLWEALTIEELCSFIYEKVFEPSSDNIAESLVKKSREEGSTDNITAIFVTLKTSLTQIAKPVDNPDD